VSFRSFCFMFLLRASLAVASRLTGYGFGLFVPSTFWTCLNSMCYPFFSRGTDSLFWRFIRLSRLSFPFYICDLLRPFLRCRYPLNFHVGSEPAPLSLCFFFFPSFFPTCGRGTVGSFVIRNYPLFLPWRFRDHFCFSAAAAALVGLIILFVYPPFLSKSCWYRLFFLQLAFLLSSIWWFQLLLVGCKFHSACFPLSSCSSLVTTDHHVVFACEGDSISGGLHQKVRCGESTFCSIQYQFFPSSLCRLLFFFLWLCCVDSSLIFILSFCLWRLLLQIVYPVLSLSVPRDAHFFLYYGGSLCNPNIPLSGFVHQCFSFSLWFWFFQYFRSPCFTFLFLNVFLHKGRVLFCSEKTLSSPFCFFSLFSYPGVDFPFVAELLCLHFLLWLSSSPARPTDPCSSSLRTCSAIGRAVTAFALCFDSVQDTCTSFNPLHIRR